MNRFGFARWWGLVLGVALLGCLTAGPAPAAEKVVSQITKQEVLRLLLREGYAASLDKAGEVVWKMDGFTALMFVPEERTSLQYSIVFTEGKWKLETVNRWNRDRRYSRSYLDKDGDLHLELDLDLVGGVTEARILDFFRTCLLSFQAWNKEVVQ